MKRDTSFQPGGDRGPASAPALEPGGSRDARFFRVLRFSHIFSSAVREVLETKYLREVTPLPLTLPQFHLLKLISLNGKHQVGEVAEFLGVSSPAASKNIDKLVRLGLVERTADEEDRRVTLLSASEEGRRLVDAYVTLNAERLAPVLATFEPEEVDQLAHLLERFSVQLFAQEKTDSGFCLRCAAHCADQCPVGHALGNCPYDRIRQRNRLTE